MTLAPEPSFLESEITDEPPIMKQMLLRLRGVDEAVQEARVAVSEHFAATETELALLRSGTSQEAETARTEAETAIRAAREQADRDIEAAESAAVRQVDAARETARREIEAAEGEADARIEEVETAARGRVEQVEAEARDEVARVTIEASGRVDQIRTDAEQRVADAVAAVEAANQAAVAEVARVESELNDRHASALASEREEHRVTLARSTAEADAAGRRSGRNLALNTLDVLSVTAGDLAVREVSVLMADALSHDRLTPGFPALELDVPATV
ncbi:hypothetical protein GCM10025867_46910 (plasmid) [Frondihabitans sucicola]|uniref:Uncharacterized protein n=1 Tax=Frondihabitans sucicola TaxID=1268041 RepID=A0ABM8GVL1_9MICO|nr:hypothetical protein [Frondihabitans sucicola]BDZ52450.1 hypothetical protein GCM10025867_46910 [Frondihabitans sucicola]